MQYLVHPYPVSTPQTMSDARGATLSIWLCKSDLVKMQISTKKHCLCPFKLQHMVFHVVNINMPWFFPADSVVVVLLY